MFYLIRGLQTLVTSLENVEVFFFKHKWQYLFPAMAKDWSVSWGYNSSWHLCGVTHCEKRTANGSSTFLQNVGTNLLNLMLSQPM